MRIVYLAPRLIVAGGIRVIIEHVNRLGARGHECHIVVHDESPPELDWLETTAELHALSELPALAADSDAVVATAWFTAYDVNSLPSGPKKCYLVQGQETVFLPGDPQGQAAVEATFRLPFEFITVSSYLVDYLKEHDVRASLALNGVDFDRFFPDPDPFPRTDDRPRVLVEGDSRQPWKRVRETIACLAGLPIEIWTFDPGEDAPRGSHRHFTAPDQDTIRRIYSSCDVLAKGSVLEGFGYGPAEAMACRTAVATLDYRGGKDVCVNGKTALVAPPDDFRALRKAVERLLADEPLRTRLARAGYERVRTTLVWEKSIEALEKAMTRGVPRKRMRHRAGPETVKPLPYHAGPVKTEVEGRPEGMEGPGFEPIPSEVAVSGSGPDPWLPSRTKKRVFLLTADFWGCGWYRMHVPGLALAAKGYEVAMEDEMPPNVIEHFDVFVLQRQYRPEMISVVQTLKAMGKTVIGELDDDFWHLHEDSPVLGFWYANGKEKLKTMERFLGQCDFLTTSTKPLAHVLRQFNPKVKVLPNMLPTSQWTARRQPRDDGTLVIGWAGGEPHGKDVALLAGTMDQIVEEYPHVELHLCGMQAYPFRPHPRVKTLTPVTIEHYPKLLAGFDIGLAPIIDSQFNRAKSDLKFIEYGMVGVPAVLSRVEPYVRTVKHGENGFLAQNPKDWLKFLKRLIEDEKLRTDIAKAAHEYALTRTIEKNLGLWEEAYGLE